jgi:hypothetical protein
MSALYVAFGADKRCTNKFNGIASGFLGVTLDPEVLEVGQRELVYGVLGMELEKAVVQQGDRPEFFDTLQHLPAFLVDGNEFLLRLAF